MKRKRTSIWNIWNMSFGFLGIQFGFALLFVEDKE
jgi:hypothetical protein